MYVSYPASKGSVAVTCSILYVVASLTFVSLKMEPGKIVLSTPDHNIDGTEDISLIDSAVVTPDHVLSISKYPTEGAVPGFVSSL